MFVFSRLLSWLLVLLSATVAFSQRTGLNQPANCVTAPTLACLAGRTAAQTLILGATSAAAGSGTIRFANAQTVCWEADPAGTDVCISVDAAELFGTTAASFVVDSDAGGSEPANGAGLRIEGGSGDITISYDATGNDLEFAGATGGYNFSGPVSIAGAGNAEFIDQSSECSNPASGSTSICTMAGKAYVRDTSGTSLKLIDVEGATLTGHLALSGDASEGLSGAGLTDCDTPATSKLLWDVTTNKFSCGTDQDASLLKLGGIIFDFGSAALTTSDEWAFRLQPFAATISRIECEAYSGTSFTIKVCKDEDLGDDTCATNLLSSTESTTLECTTAGAYDDTINSGGVSARGEVSIVITAVNGTVTKGEVYIEGTH